MTNDLHIPDIGKVKALIASEAPGASYTFSNGITESSGAVKLGGDVDEYRSVVISEAGAGLEIYAEDSVLVGLTVQWQGGSSQPLTGMIYIDDATGDFRDGGFYIDPSGVLGFNGDAGEVFFLDPRASGNKKGIEYAADYSADFTDRSLVDKAYVDAKIVELLYAYNLI
jgi:hypothetical protein